MKTNKPENQQSRKLWTALLVLLGGGLTAEGALADSGKVPWKGHFYQRFDSSVGWEQARLNCQNAKGHLATVASAAENDFLFALIPSTASQSKLYALGGKYVNQNWTWISGEPWVYENWYYYSGSKSYMGMQVSDGRWYDSDGSDVWLEGYFCEWEGRNTIASATVPDLNGNGVKENAVLYQSNINNRHFVEIRDPAQHKTLIKLSFGSSPIPPVDLAVIADISGNGRPEIAVLEINPSTRQPTVIVKDALDDMVIFRTIPFLISGFKPVSLAAYPDANGNGFDELAVTGYKFGTKSTTEVKDSSTLELLYTDTF